MHVFEKHKDELTELGYTIIERIHSDDEIQQILSCIEQADSSRETFRKSTDLFAIRQFLRQVPQVVDHIFNDNLNAMIRRLFGEDYFIVKSIYFDKPETSNWYVSYHQDLTISVDRKLEINGFTNWTTKQNQFAVHPPLDILEGIFTVRIHLDDTDEHNGALRVIPKSHLKGIYKAETIDLALEGETSCNVPHGGVMVMKPLLMHSSSRTTNGKKRRVIHIEFSNTELPQGLQWVERMSLTAPQTSCSPLSSLYAD